MKMGVEIGSGLATMTHIGQEYKHHYTIIHGTFFQSMPTCESVSTAERHAPDDTFHILYIIYIYLQSMPTCESVSTAERHAPDDTFHIRMWRSAVPPPLAKICVLHGHQDIAWKWVGRYEKSRGVCETLQYAPGDNKVEKSYF